MKTSLKLASLLVLASSFAAVNAVADSRPKGDLYRFDIQCRFDNHRECAASARIFKRLKNDDSTSPRWLTDLLAIECDGQLISAGMAPLKHTNEDGFRYEIFSQDGRFEIDLRDHPFGSTPKTVQANLEFDHQEIQGECLLRPTRVHDRDEFASE